MPTYTFQNAENTSVWRDNDDGSFTSIPWSTDPVEPLYLDSVSGRQWVEDGSPVPHPYVAPPEPEPAPPPPDAVVVQMHYRAKTLTQSIADPGNTFIAWNTVAQVDASRLAISARSDANIDQGNFWRMPGTVGKFLVLQLSTNSQQAQRFLITEVIDNDTWFDVGVTPDGAQGGPFSGNNPLYVVLGAPGAQTPVTQSGVTQEQFAALEARVAKLEG